MSAILGVLAMAGLFALFGLLRPAEHGEAGCGGCEHATEECGGGAGCPLLRDL
jgi:hypothetical protein